MIRFIFDPGDIEDEGSRDCYHTVVIEKEGMEEATIGEVIELFKSFLAGMSYVEGNIREYLGDGDEYFMCNKDSEDEPEEEEPTEEEASV